MKKEDVVIVGGGPVGLLCALGLARMGIRSTVLEAAPAISDSPRAIVYHWSVLAGLERLGVLEDVQNLGFKKNDYRFQVFKTGEQIDWTIDVLKGHARFPYNVHLGQDKMAAIAVEHLQREGLTTIEWGARVTDIAQDADGVTVRATVNGEERQYQAAWLIGADGAGSTVRESIGAAFEGMTWARRFIATNIRQNLEAFGYARAVNLIDDRFGAIIAKIDKQDLWRCTFCEDADLPLETVAERIPQTLRSILPDVDGFELVQYSPYRMHQRSASSLRKGRVVIAGDAAHVTSPTGGLGLTSGLFDVYVLYDALAAIIQGRAEADILDRYSVERLRVFNEIASPQAVENNRLVYESSDPEKLEQALQRVRRMAGDPSLLLERTLFTMKLETPSLVTGERTNALD